ncbi:porin [Sorangium sp. So ce1078]|uniref:porin n=1 Tax=Sorangium sp. So ce1078 TaxID=3133329 RepID=UPI003F640CFE
MTPCAWTRRGADPRCSRARRRAAGIARSGGVWSGGVAGLGGAAGRRAAAAAVFVAAAALWCPPAGAQPSRPLPVQPPAADPLPVLPPAAPALPDPAPPAGAAPPADPAPAAPPAAPAAPPAAPATPPAAAGPGAEAAPPAGAALPPAGAVLPPAAHALPPGGAAPPGAAAAPSPAGSDAAPSSGGAAGSPFQLSIGRLLLSPLVLVQAQAAPYVGEDAFLQAGDVAEGQGFRMRRARVGFAGTLAGYVPFAVSGELAAGADATPRLSEAWIGYAHFPFAHLYFGAHDVPFSRSAMTGAGEGALVERPLAVRAMAPFRQVGLHVEGHFRDRTFSYFAGMFNGFQRSDQFFTGYIENAASFGNRFDHIAYVARLATEPLGPLPRSMQDLAVSRPRLGAGASYFFSDGGTRDIHGIGADVLFQAEGAHALAELLWNQSDPESAPTQPLGQLAPVTSLGLVGEVGYFVKRIKLGVSARFEWLDPNLDLSDETDSWALTAGASYHFIDNVLKAQADFTHRQEVHGVALDNDAVALQLQLNL